MKSLIQLSFKDLEPTELEASVLSLAETTIKIHELKLGYGIHLFQIMHLSLNTLFDFSKFRDYQLLYFDSNKKFTGASFAISRAQGDFLIQTQSKCVILIPFETALHNELINKLEKFNY